MLGVQELRFFFKNIAWIAMLMGVPYANYLWLVLELSDEKI